MTDVILSLSGYSLILVICCIKLIPETWWISSISMPKISSPTWVSLVAHDSEPAATSLHHIGCLTGDGNQSITSLASFNQPWKADHKEQKSTFLGAALGSLMWPRGGKELYCWWSCFEQGQDGVLLSWIWDAKLS